MKEDGVTPDDATQKLTSTPDEIPNKFRNAMSDNGTLELAVGEASLRTPDKLPEEFKAAINNKAALTSLTPIDNIMDKLYEAERIQGGIQ